MLQFKILFYSLLLDCTHNLTESLQHEHDRDPAHQDPKNTYKLVCSDFGPYQPTNFTFPKIKGRKFRKEWYVTFQWLEYSLSKDCILLLLPCLPIC